jgi:transcriptional regulator of nitric oxide reductase
VAVETAPVTVVVTELSVVASSAALADAAGMRSAAPASRHAPASTRREDQALRIHTVPNSGKNYLQLRHTIAG